MEKYSEESFYNYLESIRKAADDLENFHIYQLHASVAKDQLSSEICDLEKRNSEYELQLADSQKMIDSLDKEIERLKDVNNRLITANNQLISEKKLAEENKQVTQDQAEKIVQAYNKLPRIVKKMYGVK